MPYIGNTAGNRFVASQAATRLSGNGSNKVFTLEHSVASDEDILVSVDGVIQEPSISYVVSNGTTLTFQGSDAPSNGTNNIFVCYLFRTVATVDHPSSSSLQATDATFTGDVTVDTNTLHVDTSNNKVGIGTTSPSQLLDIEFSDNSGGLSGQEIKNTNTGTTANFASLSTNAVNGTVTGIFGSAYYPTWGNAHVHMGSQTNHPIKFITNNTVKATIDGSGNVTKPSNPSFRAVGTNGAYITTSPVQFNSVSGSGGHNTGSHYNTSNYRFTAPVAGRYLFHVHMGIIRVTGTNGFGYPYIRINGTNITYSYYQTPSGTSGQYVGAFITQIFELSASDYVDITFTGSNADYYGNSTELSFMGCLLG